MTLNRTGDRDNTAGVGREAVNHYLPVGRRSAAPGLARCDAAGAFTVSHPSLLPSVQKRLPPQI
ncbi:hypothetical protein EYF80_045864 [Liparis tanakae]|uniref:Uncharacterized protein n=1 Tax=Liparis tanakae TaxID=230148 RepID=A0A4Z2FSV1_9TELE|nr:hypothetical protein EYF80_045864 [Liparis tanakae]